MHRGTWGCGWHPSFPHFLNPGGFSGLKTTTPQRSGNHHSLMLSSQRRPEKIYLRNSSWRPVFQVLRNNSPPNERGSGCSAHDADGVAVRSLQLAGSSRTGWQPGHPSCLTMPYSTLGSCPLGRQLRPRGEDRSSMWPELFCSTENNS